MKLAQINAHRIAVTRLIFQHRSFGWFFGAYNKAAMYSLLVCLVFDANLEPAM